MRVSPQIVVQTDLKIGYMVPSRTRAGVIHTHVARAFKDDICLCEALQWRDPDFKCVHYKAVTIPPTERLNFEKLYAAMRTKAKAKFEAWPYYVGCMKPEHYNPSFLYCQTCPLFPETCNIRLIKYKRNAYPLIWRLRALMSSGHKAQAREVFWTIRKNLAAAPERVPTRPRPVDIDPPTEDIL